MLVRHVGLAAVDVRSFRLVVANGGNDFKLRIPRLDRVIKLREACVVALRFVEPIFVADFNIVQFERRGMTVLGALARPTRVRVAGHIFDFIERILHERFEVRIRD